MTTFDGTSDVVGDLHAIEQLKYAYFRLLDTKRFEELGALFTDDATTSYQNGELCQHGRDEIVAFLRSAIGDEGIVTMHHGHHPEIHVGGDDATGRWYLEDRVVVPGADLELRGTALYEDRYRRTADGWRISHTGYQRIFEEERSWRTGELRRFTSRVGTSR